MAPQTTTALPHPPLLVGSEWRRWDLHIHSPLSALNNQFPSKNGEPDWDAYIESIELLDDIVAVGITDYFAIDGYKQVLKYRGAGKLQNIKLILPNIEFRLDTFVGSQSLGKRVNLHVIFSNEVTASDIEEHFLRELKFGYDAASQNADERWSVTRENLQRLGAKLKSEHSFNGSDFEIGCMNATVNLGELKEALAERRSIFEGKYLLLLADEGLSEMPWGGQAHNTRKLLYKGSHGIFSGNPSTRDFHLGAKHPSVAEYVSEFGPLKPCIHGSDAHELGKIGKPDLKRFCWIKADVTFEGLKQILYEPEDRLCIAEEPPNPKNDYQVIKSVTITNSPDWFSFRPIQLNRDLVTVIGGRGSGKSAMAELIAFGAGAESFRESKDIEDSFLSKASKKSPTNQTPITTAKIEIEWASGERTLVNVPENLRHGQKEEKVKYLPQKFVESTCAPENTAKLEAEIERVIFQRIPKTDRLGSSSLRELRQMRSGAVQVKKQQMRSSIEKVNRSVFDAFKKKSQKEFKKSELAKSEAELNKLSQKPPDLPDVNTADQARVSLLNIKKQAIEAEVAQLKQKLSSLDGVEARMASFAEEIQAFNDDITKLLGTVDLVDRKADFEIRVPAEYVAAIDQRRLSLNLQVSKLMQDGDQSLAVVANEITGLTKQFQISDTKRLEYENFQKQKQSLEDNIAALKSEISEIETVLEPALDQGRAKRLELYLDYFELLLEEKRSVDKLYEPLHAALQRGTDTDKKLEFVSRISFDAIAHAQKGFDLIDSRRRTKYKSKDELSAALKSLMSTIENLGYEREATKKEIISFRNTFLKDSDGQAITIGDQLRTGKTEEEFNNWFYELESFSVRYSMRFDGKDLGLLSPGQKGIVLLLVYLEVDQDDRRPLIIDQPEDNLDNLSIYSNLVQYFRNRKKTRQIIIITHNPNLVVNTDSEQVIEAGFDGSRKPRIVYTSGSLENTSADPSAPGIRERVCQILEGGTEAFRKREEKYSLPAI